MKKEDAIAFMAAHVWASTGRSIDVAVQGAKEIWELTHSQKEAEDKKNA